MHPSPSGVSLHGAFLVLLGLCLLSPPMSVAQDQDTPINPGLSGTWFDPALDGQGFTIEVIPSLQAVFLGWFTFSPDTSPSELLWLTAFGPYQDNVASLDLVLTTGGGFTDAGETSDSAPGTIGTVRIEFTSCTTATLSYELFSPAHRGEHRIERLTPDVRCAGLRKKKP